MVTSWTDKQAYHKVWLEASIFSFFSAFQLEIIEFVSCSVQSRGATDSRSKGQNIKFVKFFFSSVCVLSRETRARQKLAGVWSRTYIHVRTIRSVVRTNSQRIA